jgi:O-antigen ligase
MISYFTLQLLGALWSDNIESAKFAWEVKASLLFVPLIAAIPGSNVRRTWLWSVLWGVVLYLIWRFGSGLWVYVSQNDLHALHYAGLAGDVHPTYLAMYAAVALVVLPEVLGRTWWRTFVAGLLVLGIGFLGSKAGVVAGLPAVLIYAYRTHWSKDVRLAAPQAVLLVALLVGSAALSSGDRFVELATTLETAMETDGAGGLASGGEAVKSSSSGRLAVWRSSLELIAAHPMGVGTGDVEHELNALYRRDGVDYALDRRLNPHNQWLQAGVAFGWPGIMVWSALLLAGFVLARRRRDATLAAFALVIGLHACFESILEAQRGVVFVSMGLALLANGLPSRPNHVH